MRALRHFCAKKILKKIWKNFKELFCPDLFDFILGERRGYLVDFLELYSTCNFE